MAPEGFLVARVAGEYLEPPFAEFDGPVRRAGDDDGLDGVAAEFFQYRFGQVAEADDDDVVFQEVDV